MIFKTFTASASAGALILAGCASDGTQTARRSAHPYESEFERHLRLDPFATLPSPLRYYAIGHPTPWIWEPSFGRYHPFWADPWHSMRHAFGYGSPRFHWPYGYTSLYGGLYGGSYGGFWNPYYYARPVYHDGRGRRGRNAFGDLDGGMFEGERRRGRMGETGSTSFEERFPSSRGMGSEPSAFDRPSFPSNEPGNEGVRGRESGRSEQVFEQPR